MIVLTATRPFSILANVAGIYKMTKMDFALREEL